MIQTIPLPQRVENLESRVHEIMEAPEEIQLTQNKILAHDEELFRIHKHNEEYLKDVVAVQEHNEKLMKEIAEKYNQLMDKFDV